MTPRNIPYLAIQNDTQFIEYSKLFCHMIELDPEPFKFELRSLLQTIKIYKAFNIKRWKKERE